MYKKKGSPYTAEEIKAKLAGKYFSHTPSSYATSDIAKARQVLNKLKEAS